MPLCFKIGCKDTKKVSFVQTLCVLFILFLHTKENIRKRGVSTDGVRPVFLFARIVYFLVESAAAAAGAAAS